MKKSRFALAAAAALAITTLVTGCTGNADSGANDPAGVKDAAAEKVVVGIDVPFHPIYAYMQGKSDELFADTDYTVEFTVLDATTQVPAFGRGDLDVITTVPSFQPRIKEQYGIDTSYFFPMARWTPGPELLVAPGSTATSIEDLAGKRVAIAPLASRFGGEQTAVMAATGERIDEYFELVETDAAAQELAQGRVDAAFLEAPATAPLLEDGYTPIFNVQQAFEEAFGDPGVMNGGFITSTAFAEQNPEFIATLVEVTQEVWTLFQEDPATVIAVASEVSGVPPEQLELVGQVLNLTDMTEEQKRVSQRDVETWTELYPLLQESGFIAEAPKDPASLFIVSAG